MAWGDAIPASLPDWSLKVLTPAVAPDDLPVTVAAARKQCRIAHTDDDDLLESLIRAAADQSMAWARCVLCPQTVTAEFARFPCGRDPLRLPVGPSRGVVAVRYYATGGTLTTWDAANRQEWTAHNPPLVAPAPGAAWPEAQRDRLAPVQIDYYAGWATAAAIPAALQRAVLILVAFNHQNPEGFERSGKVAVPPAAAAHAMAAGFGGYG